MSWFVPKKSCSGKASRKLRMNTAASCVARNFCAAHAYNEIPQTGWPCIAEWRFPEWGSRRIFWLRLQHGLLSGWHERHAAWRRLPCLQLLPDLFLLAFPAVWFWLCLCLWCLWCPCHIQFLCPVLAWVHSTFQGGISAAICQTILSTHQGCFAILMLQDFHHYSAMEYTLAAHVTPGPVPIWYVCWVHKVSVWRKLIILFWLLVCVCMHITIEMHAF